MTKDRCEKCGADLRLTGRSHRCRGVGSPVVTSLTRTGPKRGREVAVSVDRPKRERAAAPEKAGVERITFSAPAGTSARIEAYRVARGLRSTSAVLRALLDGGLK